MGFQVMVESKIELPKNPEEMEGKLAVGVGYGFNVFTYKQLSHIKLEKTKTFLNINGSVVPLCRGTTFEESCKVDGLLNRYGEFRAKDYAYKR